MTTKLITRVLVLVLSLTLLGMFTVSGTPTAPAKGPYQSALLNVGAGTAWAAACNHRICEFVHPGYHCLFEGGATSCVAGSPRCKDVACN